MGRLLSTAGVATVAVLAVCGLFSSARAAVITFDNAPLGPFAGPATEAGFTFTNILRDLAVLDTGSPNDPDLADNHDMEGSVGNASDDSTDVLDNELQIKMTNGGVFSLTSFDLGVDASSTVDVEGIIVDGYLNGALVATDTYENNTTNGTYNWMTEDATNIGSNVGDVFGSNIDTLVFTLPAFYPLANSDTPAAAAIDDVVLGVPSTTVPEPASLAVLGSALLGFGAIRRRPRRVVKSYSRRSAPPRTE